MSIIKGEKDFYKDNTGYNDNETETGNAQTKILEFVSSSIKNNTK